VAAKLSNGEVPLSKCFGYSSRCARCPQAVNLHDGVQALL
jgi:hypothetical protein